jgi:SSS family solute:Na+ symporter
VTGDYAVIALYIAGMLGVGWYGLRLAKTKSDYLVAGRRLGFFMYSGTMSAVVLGGASTVGGVKLGYKFGISGMWLVVSIGVGILVLHSLFARRLVKLRVYTVGEMLDLRYGGHTSAVSGIVMWGYTLMLTVTSTLAFATIFKVLFDLPNWAGIAVGGSIVVLYSVLGGMWSITLTDIAQFVIKTIGILAILLPVAIASAGGFSGMAAKLDESYFSLTSIGGDTIVTYFVIYTFGLLIGQDIWQRVFTARTPGIATAGGITSGVYCLVYGLAGALIGTAAKALYPDIASAQDAFATIVERLLPTGVRGLVLAAALSAMMSTASGALIACSTTTTSDLLSKLGLRKSDGDVHRNRVTTLVLGLVAIGIAMIVDDVVNALTIAYDILVGGLLVAIIGALVWKRGTRQGAYASMIAGTVFVIAFMLIDGVEANSPIYWGLGASLLVYVAVSFFTPRTSDSILSVWTNRLNGSAAAEEDETATGTPETVKA